MDERLRDLARRAREDVEARRELRLLKARAGLPVKIVVARQVHVFGPTCTRGLCGKGEASCGCPCLPAQLKVPPAYPKSCPCGGAVHASKSVLESREGRSIHLVDERCDLCGKRSEDVHY